MAQLSSTSINGDLTVTGIINGNAITAEKLTTPRKINGVNFNGESDITITAAANGGNATTLGGLGLGDVSNSAANKVVRTNGSGYIQCGWLNTTSGIASGTLTRVYCSQDNYLRYFTPTDFINNLGLAKKTDNVASATKLETARTIGISGGATGTATSFNGTGNITIPVTGLNMGNANAGTLAIARGGTGNTIGKATYINDTRANANMRVWYGTEAQYTALSSKDANTIYFTY